MGRSKYEFVSWGNYLFMTFVRLWASFGAVFFFRRFKVTGKDDIPQEGPVIFCCNHQSAFLDPVLLGITSGRKPWYITQAGVFTTETVRFLLHSLHMLPIFRPRDKVDIKAANVDTFEKSEEILKGDGSMVIFVEGNHDMRNRLRVPLKKGFARIAFGSASIGGKPAMIVPVGLTYEEPIHPRGDILVQYGKPFSVAPYLEMDQQNEAMTQLVKDLEKAMKPLVIDIADTERYDEIEAEWQLSRKPENKLVDRFNSDKKLISAIEAGKHFEPSKSRRNGILNWVLRLLSLPVIIIGVLLNLPLILLAKWIIKKLVRDPHFDQSIKFVSGMGGVPIFGFFLWLILYLITGEGWPSFATVIIGPVLGLYAYDLINGLWRDTTYVPLSERMKMRR